MYILDDWSLFMGGVEVFIPFSHVFNGENVDWIVCPILLYMKQTNIKNQILNICVDVFIIY